MENELKRDDLIRRSDLKQHINSLSSHWLCEWDTLGVLAAVDSIPAVDAVEVRHGRWLPHPNKEYPDTEVCSSCGMGTITGKFIFQFCPWRGASMDGEEEHNAAD